MPVTNWRPDLSTPSGPIYRELADQICAAVARGAIQPGDKLPPVRDLAWQAGVSPGAVARAYRIGIDRGALEATVGRGTFARGRPGQGRAPAIEALVDEGRAGKIDLRGNRAADVGQDEALTAALARLIERNGGALPLTRYPRSADSAPDREALARWLAADGVPAEAERLIVTSGAHEALTACLAALGRAGNGIVLTEPLIHPGMRDAANAIGFRIEAVAADDQGMLPDALAATARRLRPDAVLLSSALHNPTATTMGDQRRRDIAAVAREHDLSIIEDDVYGLLARPHRGTLAAEAPERTWYVASLSKCVAAGIRAGLIVTPADRLAATRAAHQSLIHRTPWLIHALAGEIVRSGDASRIRDAVRAEIRARTALAAEFLAPLGAQMDPEASFALLPLAPPWHVLDFVSAAAMRDVLVAPGSAYWVGRPGQAPEVVRIAFGAGGAAARTELAEGLGRLVELMGEGPRSGLGVT